jgi:putative hydrolase of the HAD superfamily
MVTSGGSLRGILFDWGGTLMREIPGFDGPMADWPRVEAIPGAAETLRSLHGAYAIAVATNAALSDERLVRTALARVGLDGYVSVVATARDLGTSKPDPEFFHVVVKRIGCPPAEAAMVGDSYGSDVVGAKAAELRAIWFNPAGAPCPVVHPVHDAEIRALADLPTVLGRRWLPDIAEALAILRSHEVPPNIVRHSGAVAAAAHHLGRRLRDAGIPVDPLVVHRGGLLHDLDKVSSETPAEHGVKSGRILRELGWPDLAGIAERHVLGSTPLTWEEKLVHYADKIVEEDELVGLVDRVTALSCRYAAAGDQITRALPQLLALEQEIVRHLAAPQDTIMAELRRLDPGLPPLVSLPGAAYDRLA